MKRIVVIIILCISNWSFGQIAIIKDDDGFTNVRKLPNIKAEIIYRLKDTEVFSYNTPNEKLNSDWVTIYISKNKYQLKNDEKDTLIGYIHKSRLCPIEDLEVYTGINFLFKYKLQKFSLENKISDYDGKRLTKIDGQRIYGTDGDMPKIEVKEMHVTINGQVVNVPKILYKDIFECNNKFLINKNKESFIVSQWNSDGAGAYLIVWVFNAKEVIQRLILIP